MSLGIYTDLSGPVRCARSFKAKLANAKRAGVRARVRVRTATDVPMQRANRGMKTSP